jgi:hypothetical protein
MGPNGRALVDRGFVAPGRHWGVEGSSRRLQFNNGERLKATVVRFEKA